MGAIGGRQFYDNGGLSEGICNCQTYGSGEAA